MTKEEAKKLLPIIHALAEGKTIQFQKDPNVWVDMDNPTFSKTPNDYRIKPEPKCRPFKNQEECWEEMQKHKPFGFLKPKDNECFYFIGSVNKDDTITLAIEPNTDYAYHYIFEHYIFSDGTPFGIKE